VPVLALWDRLDHAVFIWSRAKFAWPSSSTGERIMRFAFLIFALLVLSPGAALARAGGSCSSFAVIKSYDADAKTVEVAYEKGKLAKYFPRPEGASQERSQIPKGCRSKVKKTTTLVVKPTGGRMTVTQLRSNLDGKMLNDTEDPAWLPAQLGQLIANQTPVVVVIRPGIGKDAPLGITTVYLPITEEELADIKRMEDEAKDM
jgi:hypothetical protein